MGEGFQLLHWSRSTGLSGSLSFEVTWETAAELRERPAMTSYMFYRLTVASVLSLTCRGLGRKLYKEC